MAWPANATKFFSGCSNSSVLIALSHLKVGCEWQSFDISAVPKCWPHVVQSQMSASRCVLTAPSSHCSMQMDAWMDGKAHENELGLLLLLLVLSTWSPFLPCCYCLQWHWRSSWMDVAEKLVGTVTDAVAWSSKGQLVDTLTNTPVCELVTWHWGPNSHHHTTIGFPKGCVRGKFWPSAVWF